MKERLASQSVERVESAGFSELLNNLSGHAPLAVDQVKALIIATEAFRGNVFTVTHYGNCSIGCIHERPSIALDIFVSVVNYGKRKNSTLMMIGDGLAIHQGSITIRRLPP